MGDKWVMKIESRPGKPLIIGNAGRPDVGILIHRPDAPTVLVVSGTKAEHGPGGFECLVYEPGKEHVLEVDSQAAFKFTPFEDATTWIELTEVDPTDPEPEPEPEPQPEPEPEPEPGDPWPALFAKLTKIEDLLSEHVRLHHLEDPFCAPSRAELTGVADE